MILLPFFFMYIFPLFFLALPVLRTTPIFATVLLCLGIILWMIMNYQILGFIRKPGQLARRHRQASQGGKRVLAEIIASRHMGMVGGLPQKELLLSFPNLVGQVIRSKMSVLDSKAHLNRFEPGNQVPIKLNRTGFEPPFTLEGADYVRSSRPWAWFWLLFNTIYMIGFFLLSYYLQSDGFGWRFLNPFSPWLWAPIIGIVLLKLLGGSFNQDIIEPSFGLSTARSSKDVGELLLYGVNAPGELIDYAQTGTYINEQPQIRFKLQYLDQAGTIATTSFQSVIPLTQLHKLSPGEVEVLYLPGRSDILMVDFLND